MLCLAVDHREVYIMSEKWVTTRSLGTSDLKNQKSPNSYLQTVRKAMDAFKCSNSAKLSFFCLSCILVTPTVFPAKSITAVSFMFTHNSNDHMYLLVSMPIMYQQINTQSFLRYFGVIKVTSYWDRMTLKILILPKSVLYHDLDTLEFLTMSFHGRSFFYFIIYPYKVNMYLICY